jgi:hypothetical protein
MFRSLSQSRVRRPGTVQRGGPLEHDPLIALIAGGVQQHRGLARERGRYLHGAGDRQAEIIQQGAAKHVRAAHQVVAAGPQHVEHDQRDRDRGQQPGARSAGGHPPLQRGEVRPRTGQGDDLPVQDQSPAPGRGREHAEFGIGGGDVAAAAGPGPDSPARHCDAGPQAVPLHLGHELGGIRR